ncbi:putative ribonuclease H-like domain-containing protein [Tanacetum coccineum]|uniref:Ribonuclease H-like domain-containing protein n=1 Tax=Tanacetum coccineum TaxID=301880 RepID=A0ABQ4YJN2_9ASTR
MKTKGTLLMALPNKDQLKFHSYKDAKLLMEAIEKRYGGNKESKKVQRTLLKKQYENFAGLIITQEDMNLRLLRSLPSEWKTHALIWRNKEEIETISLDDLYNNLKIYEPELAGSSSTSQNPQNVAFVSSSSTNSNCNNIINEANNTAHGSNSLQLVREDLEQIDPDDLEEMDLQWEMAMLTIRARRFIQRTGRKLDVNGQRVGFDRTKVECYNCHKYGHFARECRVPRNQENRGRENNRRTVTVETPTENALVAQDGLGGYDWSYQAEEEHPTNFALMAHTSLGSSSSSDSEVDSCSKSCVKAYATLKEQYDSLSSDYKRSQFNLVSYKAGLESVEARLAHYKKNEAVFEESINVLKLEVKLRDTALVENKKKLEKAEKERDELKLTLEKFQNSSKSLNNLLESQVIDKFKTGLGYNAASSTAASPAVESFVNSSEMLENQENNKSKSDKGYHAVPPPFTGNFIPFKPDLTFMDEIVESENMDVTTIVTPSNVKTVESNHESADVKSNGDAVEPKTVRKNSFRPPVIEDWNSNDESEVEIIPKDKTVISSTEKIKLVKSAREIVEKVETSKQNKHYPRGNQRNWNNLMSQKLGSDFKMINKACFVCGSFEHLHYVCDKKVIRPVWNNSSRVNHKNFANKITHPHPNRRFVPQAVLTRSGKIDTASANVNTAVRPVNTAGSKPTVNHPRPISNAYKKGYLQVTRPFNKYSEYKNSIFNKKVNTVRVKDTTARDRAVGNPHQKEYKEKGVFESGCSRHMTGNKCYLTEYEDYDGGFVSFGDGKGRISGKEKKETQSLLVLVIKPHNKTPYELIRGRTPLIDFMKPFGCPVTILNTRDHLGKFDGKADEGFFVGYSVVSKAMRVFNKRNRIVEETLNIRFLENTPNVTGNGPDWLFDVDSLTISMNYVPVVAGNQTNGIAGTRDNIVTGQAEKKTEPEQEYILIPICTTDPLISQDPKVSEEDAEEKPTEMDENGASDKDGKDDQATRSEFERLLQQEKQTVHPNSTNSINIVSTPVSTVGPSCTDDDPSSSISAAEASNAFEEHLFEQFSPFKNAFTLPPISNVTPMDDTIIFGNTYDDENVGAEVNLNNLETTMNVSPIPTTRIDKDHPKDQIIRDFNSAIQTSRMTKITDEYAMVSYINMQRRTNHKDYQNCLLACFLSQKEPKKVIQALEHPSWVEAMQEELLQFKLQKVWTLVDLPNGKRPIGTKRVFRNKKDKRGIVVINKMDVKSTFLYGTIEKEVYVCQPPGFENLHFPDNVYKDGNIDFRLLFIKKDKGDILFQMSSMGELTFFLGLQVQQKEDGIFISQDKYVAEILKKFDFATVKTASTLIETNKALVKDEEAEVVDVHLYRSMIRSFMYLTASRLDIMFVVCACARLISWQCKKQTIVVNSTTEAEYVAAANCYETVYKEWEDIMERASTTASSVDAEQDSDVDTWHEFDLLVPMSLEWSNVPGIKAFPVFQIGDDHLYEACKAFLWNLHYLFKWWHEYISGSVVGL